MGMIVAIGGGENGHHSTQHETETFVGLANKYPDYYDVMKNISELYRK